jgi:hypothetical protein
MPRRRSSTLELAHLFALGPRIAARCSREALSAELGESSAETLSRARAGALAGEMQRDAAVGVLRQLSARLELPIALLKGLALRYLGVIGSGARFVSDTDILVPEARRWELQRALEKEGFEALALPESEQHLPVIARLTEGPIEIHRKLLGVRLAGSRRSVGFDELMHASLLEALPGEGSCFAPTREVLAAHALVHGFVQHGAHPDAYPLAVVLADLIDLGLAHEAGLGARGPGMLALGSVERLVARELDSDQLGAVVELCHRLACGGYAEREALTVDDDTPDRLLAHVLAGRLDEAYRRRLKLSWLGPRLSDRSRFAQLAHTLGTSLFPGRARLEVVYGPAPSVAGRLRHRLRHLGRLASGLGRAVSARR